MTALSVAPAASSPSAALTHPAQGSPAHQRHQAHQPRQHHQRPLAQRGDGVGGCRITGHRGASGVGDDTGCCVAVAAAKLPKKLP